MLESYDPHDMYGMSFEDVLREAGRKHMEYVLSAAFTTAGEVAVHAGDLSSAVRNLRDRLEAAKARGYLRDEHSEREVIEELLADVLSARTDIENVIANLLTQVGAVTARNAYPAPFGSGRAGDGVIEEKQ